MESFINKKIGDDDVKKMAKEYQLQQIREILENLRMVIKVNNSYTGKEEKYIIPAYVKKQNGSYAPTYIEQQDGGYKVNEEAKDLIEFKRVDDE